MLRNAVVVQRWYYLWRVKVLSTPGPHPGFSAGWKSYTTRICRSIFILDDSMAWSGLRLEWVRLWFCSPGHELQTGICHACELFFFSSARLVLFRAQNWMLQTGLGWFSGDGQAHQRTFLPFWSTFLPSVSYNDTHRIVLSILDNNLRFWSVCSIWWDYIPDSVITDAPSDVAPTKITLSEP